MKARPSISELEQLPLEFNFYPMCEADAWVPYGKTSWNGPSMGSTREECRNRAVYKDEARFVCNRHAKKKKTRLKVELGQIYAANYPTGEIAALKIERPLLEQTDG